MLLLKQKKIITMLVVMLFIASTATAFGATYENSKSFSVKLPHVSHNTTAAEADKTTGRDYGKVKITSIGSKDGCACWFRTQDSSGNWDYDLSELTFFPEEGTERINYGDIECSSGTFAQLRIENETETQFVKDKAKGTVWFN